MEFDADHKLIISSLENEERARAFIIFLETEVLRHFKDIRDAQALIKEVEDKFGINDD
jgi:hypothetical protein